MENVKNEYGLSIRLTSDGFSLSVLDGAGGPALLRREVHAPLFELSSSELVTLFNNELEAFSADAVDVSLMVQSDCYVLVPDVLFRLQQVDDYFYFQYERDERWLVLFNRVPEWSCVNVFSLPLALYEALTTWFPDVSPKHHVTEFLESRVDRKGSQVVLWVGSPTSVDIAVVADGRLQMVNRFACRTVEDVAYFALSCLEQFGLGQDNTQVRICQYGNAAACRELLSRYVERCEVIEM